jgi:carboxypeptidase Q
LRFMPCARRLALFVAVALNAALAGQGAFNPADGRTLSGTILNGDHAFQYLRELTGMFGPRLAGSANYQGAAEWAAGQFRTAGLHDVALEPFVIQRGWQRVSARARLVSPVEQLLHVQSLGWMPSTPEGGIEAEVALVADLAPEKIAAQASLKGRIALVGGMGSADAFERATRQHRLDERLRAAGAIAMLSIEEGQGNTLSARLLEFRTDIGVLPAAQIPRDEAQTIRRLLERGPVRVAIDLRNRITSGAMTVHNVVAEIRGRERPDEWVIVGAHLDSWDFATGAQDNAAGVAEVLDAARAIAALGRPPRRSIRFALWGAEELGLVGSAAYVRAHAAEMERCTASLNTDGGTGRVLGWTAPGRADLSSAMRPLASAMLRDLGSTALDESLQYAFDSDVGPFILAGVPSLDLNPDDTEYEEVHHKATDTLERVNRSNLAISAATVAVTAYAIADAPMPIAPHVDERAVATMLAAAKMDGVLQLIGLWKPG